ncbi:MAG: ribbon-helix-helix domain-containing protein [Nanoarchaeota archaeon]
MESVSLKLEDKFSRDIEKTMKRHRYTTKTEFIREAIRDKIRDLEKEEALMRLDRAYGASKRKTTYAQLKEAREEAARDIAKELGVSLE